MLKNKYLKKKSKIEKIYFWACDYKSNSGEGRLGRLFIKKFTKKNNLLAIKVVNLNSKILNMKYLKPFVGVLYAWIFYLKKKNFLYLNYLPFWNPFIFLLLPPNCKIGPITGGSIFNKDSKDYIVRKFFFPILYSISDLILRFRYKDYIFSTDLLKKHLSNEVIKKSKFNFVLHEIKNIKRQKTYKKQINLLLYFRKHSNKNFVDQLNLVKEITSRGYSVNIVGNKIKLNNVINHGYISHKKLLILLKKTKYSVVSSENIFSFFTIDSINCNVKLLVDINAFKKIRNYKDKFIKFNFKQINIKRLKLI